MGGGWLTPRSSRFTPGMTRYPLYKRLSGPQSRSGGMRKTSPPPGFDPRTFQPEASRYTDWAIPAHISETLELRNHLTRLCAWQKCIEFCRSKNFKTYTSPHACNKCPVVQRRAVNRSVTLLCNSWWFRVRQASDSSTRGQCVSFLQEIWNVRISGHAKRAEVLHACQSRT